MANLKKVVEQLRSSVKAHGKQADIIEKYMKNNPIEKKGFPEIKEKNEGKFTAWVKKNMPDKDTCAAASAIMNNKDKYKPNVVKMANYANNFGCKKK